MSFNTIVRFVLSSLYLATVSVSLVIFFCLASVLRLLCVFIDPKLFSLSLFSSFWASIFTWCVPIWSVKIHGRKKMDIQKGYVLVSNHQSQLDILLIYRLFFPMRWVSKAAVFKIPFLGWSMLLNGHVRLKRGDKESIQKMMTQCEQLLEQNISIMMFPEGTRSETGIVKPFKTGAFTLAKKKKKPILPLVINNTRKALPKTTLMLRGRNLMSINVLDEIPYRVYKDMEVEDIAVMVREKICAHVIEHQEAEQG